MATKSQVPAIELFPEADHNNIVDQPGLMTALQQWLARLGDQDTPSGQALRQIQVDLDLTVTAKSPIISPAVPSPR